MATISYLVETLGLAVARLVTSPGGTAVEIGDVIIHDPADPFEVGPGDLVVAPGIKTTDDARALLRELEQPRAAAVMLKDPIADEPDVARLAQTCGVAVISVPRGASWAQIVSLVQSVVATGARFGREPAQVHSAGDLFTLAEAIAAAVDAPVTIEDPLSRVIAYSQHQGKADSVRAQTILGRRAPEPVIARLNERGIFTRLKQSSEPIYVDHLGSGMGPRVAVAVRAGSEELGSIWAAVPGPPTEEQLAALADAARLAPLHLLRHRAGADVERKLQADLLVTLLEGRSGAPDAAQRLGLQKTGLRVLAVAPGVGDDAAGQIAADDLRAALAVHLELLHAGGAAALLAGLIYAVIQVEGGAQASAARAASVASTFLQRIGTRAASTIVGVGGYADTVADLPRSRREAEDALRVLRVSPERGSVAAIDEVRLAALLQRFQEAAAHEAALDDKIKPLIESDKTQGTAYVETLRAYLDSFGDLGAASELLYVHANTVRYRLRRIGEMTTIDLDDPDERLGLMLLLRIVTRGIRP